MKKICILLSVVFAAATGQAIDFAFPEGGYLHGGVYTVPVIPAEKKPLNIHISARISGEGQHECSAGLRITDAAGMEAARESIRLQQEDGVLQSCWQWTPGANGNYTLEVTLDPENLVHEDNEENNTTSLDLPVIIPRGPIHFVWYAEPEDVRWVTCITSTNAEQQERLLERGVLPLNWEYGGMSWSYYDKDRAATDPEAELAGLEELFYQKFTSGKVHGFGIDECGGYPGSWKYSASIASMKALVRAKAELPDRVFAVWNSGGLRPELAGLYRSGADFLLLETYVWRALPDEIGTDDIYQMISSRIDPFIRATDMFQPAYGNHCYTLLALDTSERPDRATPGELENIIRFIRRNFPEMRGIAWYNGGFGNTQYGLEDTPRNRELNSGILQCADRLSCQYWIQPCVTLMPHSLWIEKQPAGGYCLTAAISNIGAIDAHDTAMAFYIDGEQAGLEKADTVPAGTNRNQNRAFLRLPLSLTKGTYRFEARIISAPGATVLDPVITTQRYIP